MCVCIYIFVDVTYAIKWFIFVFRTFDIVLTYGRAMGV